MTRRRKTIYRGGVKRVGHRDQVAKRAMRKASRKIGRELDAAEARAKYGPSGKPAPVVVKRIEGER